MLGGLSDSIKRHQKTILFSLKDADVSIRQRALDLLFLMCDESNCLEIVRELLTFLVKFPFPFCCMIVSTFEVPLDVFDDCDDLLIGQKGHRQRRHQGRNGAQNCHFGRALCTRLQMVCALLLFLLLLLLLLRRIIIITIISSSSSLSSPSVRQLSFVVNVIPHNNISKSSSPLTPPPLSSSRK